MTEYVISAINPSKISSGVLYKNVIEVQVNYYQQTTSGDYELWGTVYHHYAKGVGEIYNYYPYPASLKYANISAHLINDQK